MTLILHVVKTLLHRPWYSSAIITVMAVGCALLTTVLAIVDGVLFKPLGYPGERELVAITLTSPRSRTTLAASADELTAWSLAAPDLAFTAFAGRGADTAAVRANFFDVIGVRPALGGFTEDDFRGPRPIIEPRIIPDGIFQTQFGGDPSALGRVVTLDPSTGSGYRIAGVMPEGFVFPADRGKVSYITPYVDSPTSHSLHRVIARSKGNVRAAGLEAIILAVAQSKNHDRPGTNSANYPIDKVTVEPLARALGAASRPLFAALLAAAGLLVALAVLNASSLMAARSIDRRRELAVRRALGASAVDIGRLLVMEAGLLVGAGTFIGLLCAAPLLQLAVSLLPEGIALFKVVSIDTRIIAFSGFAAVVFAALVVVWPLRLASADRSTTEPSRNVTVQAGSLSRRLVVTMQVGLALVLTVGGSLLVGSLLSVYARTQPIETTNVQTIAVNFLGMSGLVGRIAPERATRVDALLDRLREIPGVEAVAFTAYNLLEHAYEPSRFTRPTAAMDSRMAVVTQAVTADYYRIVQPQLIAGRWPTADEFATREPVIVVSERVASTFWPNASALGQTLTDRGSSTAPTMTFTVVGVVKEVRWAAWDEQATPMIYGPYALLARPTQGAVLIRTAAGLSRITEEALRVIGETDPLVRISRVMPFGDLFIDSVRPRRFRAWLFGSFAFASLCIVGIGIFGQLAMSTARRTREVGIRITCGATRGDIARLILGEQLIPVVAGLLAGGIAAAWAARFVRSYLYELTSSDARVWAAAIALIVLTAVAGTMVPALRASRIEPTEALRAE